MNTAQTSTVVSQTRILFFGTPTFAIPALCALHDAGATLLCVTKPDKPVGRKQLLTPPPVKTIARERGIPLLQPERLDEQVLKEIRKFRPDVAVLAAYHKLIKPDLLVLPRHGFLNVHPSLLPRHRGASPVAATILSGDTETGVTIMQMDEGLDTGPLLAQIKLPLAGTETTGHLTEELSRLGATLLLQTLPAFLDGKLRPKAQDSTRATITCRITKEEAHLHWSNDAVTLERQIRAYHPWPTAWAVLDGAQLRIHEAKIEHHPVQGDPGTLSVEGRRLLLGCGKHTTLEILTIQVAGKNKVNAREFINGYSSKLPTQLL